MSNRPVHLDHNHFVQAYILLDVLHTYQAILSATYCVDHVAEEQIVADFAVFKRRVCSHHQGVNYHHHDSILFHDSF